MIELNKIYNEPCEETMKRLPDEVIDLTVTSPPYDKQREYNGYSFDINAIAPGLYRITKWGGVLVWVVADQTVNGSESGTSMRQALKFMEAGFNLYDTMIFRKENPCAKNHRRYEQEWEYMYVFSKGVPTTFNPILIPCRTAGNVSSLTRNGYGYRQGSWRRRDTSVVTKDKKIKGNIWTYSVGNNGVSHPAPFPEELAADHIRSWSNKGDLVYDPFMGSGTTAKMALVLERKYIGSEISADYCEIARKRLNKLLVA